MTTVMLSWTLAVALASAAPPSSAEDRPRSEPDYPVDVLREAQDISASTLSPFCPGKTLSSCPSSKASEWRQDIRAMVADGMDAEAIRSRLQARTPDFDLASVPVSPLSWWGPIAIFSVLTAGLVIAALWNTRRRRTSVVQERRAPSEPAPSPEEQNLLDRELEQLD